MAKLTIRDVEYDSTIDLCPVSVPWQEDKLCVLVDEFFDKPWAGNSIHFNFLAGDPFHELDSVSWQLGSGMQSSPPFSMAPIKSLHDLRRSASAKVSAVLSSKPAPRCRS